MTKVYLHLPFLSIYLEILLLFIVKKVRKHEERWGIYAAASTFNI